MRGARYRQDDITVILDLDHTLLHTQNDMGGYEDVLKVSSEENPRWRRRLYRLSFNESGRSGIPSSTLSSLDKTKKAEILNMMKNNNMWGVFRPGAIDFYEYCFYNFSKVVVWSAGQYGYVHNIVDILHNITGKYPHLVWTYDDLDVDDNGNYLKDLYKMARDKKNIVGGINRMIIIDDTESTFSRNVENAIHIPAYKFKGDPRKAFMQEDKAFENIKAWAETSCYEFQDIRDVEKGQIFEA